MAQTLIKRGMRREVMPSTSRAAGTHASNPYMLGYANAILIYLLLSDKGAAGSVDTINILSPDGDVICQFGSLSITSNGNYVFRVAPGATKAAGSNAYKGVATEVVPAEGSVQVIHTGNAVTYSVKVEAVGP